MDHVVDLRMEPKDLADHAFRFLKVPAGLLLNKTANAQSDIHPQDLADLLARSGIDLIAERIESESVVLDLLDYDVRFGQGFLFSPPRPVRAEALQAGAARPRDQPGGRFHAGGGGVSQRLIGALWPGRSLTIEPIGPGLAALDPAFFRACSDYDVLLCDVWGVVHNGLAAFPHACDALMRARATGDDGRLHHQFAAAERGGDAPARAPACAARDL